MESIAHILGWLLTAAAGAGGTFAVTAAVKLIPSIPISDGQKTRIRAFAGATAAVSVLLLGLVNPDVAPTDMQNAIVTILTIGVSWFGAHTVHKVSQDQ